MEHALTTMGPMYATVQMVGKENTAQMVKYFIRLLNEPNSCHYLILTR